MDKMEKLKKNPLAFAKFRRAVLGVLLSGAGLTLFTACYGPAAGWDFECTPLAQEENDQPDNQGDPDTPGTPDNPGNQGTGEQGNESNKDGIVLTEDAPLPGEWR